MGIFSKTKEPSKPIQNQSILFDWSLTDNTGLMSNPTVSACVRIISDSISSIPLQVLDTAGGQAFSNPLYRLLHDQPNPLMTSTSFVGAIVKQLVSPGNAYILKAKDGFYPLNPYNIEHSIKGNVKVFTDKTTGKTYKQDEIIHIAGYSEDGIWGIDLLERNRKLIEFNNTIRKFGQRYFKNSANPSIYVKQTKPATDNKGWEQVKANFSSSYTNVDNSGAALFLPEGFDLGTVNLNAKDAMLQELLKFGILDIARAFNVPPYLLAELEKSSFSSLYAQDQQFLKYTITPWITKIEDALNTQALQAWDYGKVKVRFNLSAFARGTLEERYGAYNTALQAGFMTINEIRRLENLPAVEGGNDLRVPLNMDSLSNQNKGNNNGK